MKMMMIIGPNGWEGGIGKNLNYQYNCIVSNDNNYGDDGYHYNW